jgi:hypothetical protein
MRESFCVSEELLCFNGGICFVDSACVSQLKQKPVSAYKHGGEAKRDRKQANSNLQQLSGLSRFSLHNLQSFIPNYVVQEQKHVAALLLQKLTYM